MFPRREFPDAQDHVRIDVLLVDLLLRTSDITSSCGTVVAVARRATARVLSLSLAAAGTSARRQTAVEQVETSETDRRNAVKIRPLASMLATLALTLSLVALVGCAAASAIISSPTLHSASPTAQDAHRKDVWLDRSISTQRTRVRSQYLARTMEIVDEAIALGASLRVVAFTGASSDATVVFKGLMKVEGLNTAYLQSAKRKLRQQVEEKVSFVLSPSFRGAFVPGSDPAGAARYGVAHVRAGLGRGTSAEVWLLSDGEQTIGKKNLVRLLRHQSPKRIVATWLQPYIPDAGGAVDLHFRGLGQGTLATANTRVSLLIEEVWRRFCRAAKARTCDVRAEV